MSELRIPYKTVKRILESNVGGTVTKDSVEYIQSFLEIQLTEICKEVIVKHRELNTLRKFHGIREKRRFDSTLFKSVVVSDIYSSPGLLGKDEVAKSESTTLPEEARIEVK